LTSNPFYGDAFAARAAYPLSQNFFRLHPSRDIAIHHGGSPHGQAGPEAIRLLELYAADEMKAEA
jgi:hypothetical protein